MPDEPIPDEPGPADPERPVYRAPAAEPPPNIGATPSRGEQGGDGG